MIGIYIVFITHKFSPFAVYYKGETGVSSTEESFEKQLKKRLKGHYSWESIISKEKTYVELFLNLEEDQRD